jgi:hypothetical protein
LMRMSVVNWAGVQPRATSAAFFEHLSYSRHESAPAFDQKPTSNGKNPSFAKGIASPMRRALKKALAACLLPIKRANSMAPHSSSVGGTAGDAGRTHACSTSPSGTLGVSTGETIVGAARQAHLFPSAGRPGTDSLHVRIRPIGMRG